MKFCLDTNTLTYFFKGLGNVSKKMLAIPPAEIAIPAVVIFEHPSIRAVRDNGRGRHSGKA